MNVQLIIELVEKAEHVGILLPQDAAFDHLASAEVLARVLEAQGKIVGFALSRTASPLPIPPLLSRISEAKHLMRELVVALNTQVAPISQMRYETGEHETTIILSPKNLPLNKEAVSFREGRLKCDVAFLLGIANAEEEADGLGVEPTFFTETPLVNIDTSPKNSSYGEANIVNPEKSSLSELTYELCTSLLRAPLEREQATILLAGIIQKTDAFRAKETNADTLLACSELLRLGADRSLAFSLRGSAEPLSFMQLVGRATVRSRRDETSRVFWSFLTAEDFEKTGRTPEDGLEVLKRIGEQMPEAKTAVLLTQDPVGRSVRAILTGSSEILERVQTAEGGEFKSPCLVVENAFLTFREAEERIGALLAPSA